MTINKHLSRDLSNKAVHQVVPQCDVACVDTRVGRKERVQQYHLFGGLFNAASHPALRVIVIAPVPR